MRNSNPNSYTRYVLFVRFPALALLALLVAMGLFGKRGWLDWHRMLKQNERIESEIASTQGQKEILLKQIWGLEHDPAEQERVVREVLGYIKPNETVIEF